MKIAIDASSAAVPQKTGVPRYIQRLIEHLEEIDDENEYIIYYRLSRLKNRRYFYQPKKPTTKVRVFQEPLFTGRGIDVFHGPDARLPGIRGPRLVATLHDVFSLISDEFAGEKFRSTKITRYRDIAERADLIICVSESTRRDFARFFPEAEPKTCVIYEGVDEWFCPRPAAEAGQVKRKYGIAHDYILYVGDLCRRKNILRMCGAFRQAREQVGGNLQFVLVGKLAYGNDEIMTYLRENHCEQHILLTGYVPDEDLPALYSGARLFLFTTLYEGFGLPILEALACGTPVVTSNLSSAMEVASEATCKVNPESEQDITKAIVDILSRADDCHTACTGRTISSHYSWKTTAQQILTRCYSA